MKSLLKSLKRFIGRPEKVHTPLLTEEQAQELDERLAALKQPRGRVVRGLKKPVYTPGPGRHGGRMVKAMPRELRKIKDAQERVEHDTEM